MPIFKYIAKDSKGMTKKGHLEASDAQVAAKVLADNELTPISVEKQEHRINIFGRLFGRISAKNLVAFTRQLATMVAAGLPVSQSLHTLESQTENVTLQKVIAEVRGDVEGGTPLSNSLAKHPKVFSNIYVNLVRVGEASGKLDKVLLNLADAVERSYEFRSKVRSAMIYPAMIFFTMMVVFLFLFVFVVPQLADIYTSFDITLPVQTRLVLAISNLLVSRWWLFIILAVGSFYGFRLFKKSTFGKYFLAKLVLRIPIIGNLKKNVEVAEFTRTLGLLVGSGVPILQSLEIATESMSNVIYKDGVIAATKQVERGTGIAVALSNTTEFPPMLTQMVSVGEQTGKLDEVLNRLSEFLQRETDAAVENLSTALEPIILVILGAMVGFLVMSIVLPIYNLTSGF